MSTATTSNSMLEKLAEIGNAMRDAMTRKGRDAQRERWILRQKERRIKGGGRVRGFRRTKVGGQKGAFGRSEGNRLWAANVAETGRTK